MNNFTRNYNLIAVLLGTLSAWSAAQATNLSQSQFDAIPGAVIATDYTVSTYGNFDIKIAFSSSGVSYADIWDDNGATPFFLGDQTGSEALRDAIMNDIWGTDPNAGWQTDPTINAAHCSGRCDGFLVPWGLIGVSDVHFASDGDSNSPVDIPSGNTSGLRQFGLGNTSLSFSGVVTGFNKIAWAAVYQTSAPSPVVTVSTPTTVTALMAGLPLLAGFVLRNRRQTRRS